MSSACPIDTTGGARREVDGSIAALGPAKWLGLALGLAATPTFAVMAVLTGMFGGGGMDMLCSAAPGSFLDGMVPMYVLMSAFHAPAWMKLFSPRRRLAQQVP
jgi:uncharacterized membrane protein YeiH